MELNIFEYSNYREYLKAYYEQSKEVNENFSYRYFARKAGFSSANFLYLIIAGKRNLTKDYIPKFSKAIGLTKKEQHYFDALVSFNQAKNPEAKRYYLELIYNLRKDKTGSLLTDEQYEYISNWYYPVIREMVTLPHFEEDHAWIRKQLKNRISKRQVTEALNALIRLGLVGRDEKGRLIQTDAHVITEDEVCHAAAYIFHQQMLTLAKDVLATTESEVREISGITMAVSQKQFSEIKKRIHEFEDTILTYLTSDPDVPETIFQLNIQLFPVTNGVNGNNGGSK